MSTHPYSIYKKILLTFDEIEKIRMVYTGPLIVTFIIKSKPNLNQEDINKKLAGYIQKKRGLSDFYKLDFSWADGPLLPKEYDSLSEFELYLIEHCSGTVSEAETLIYQANPNIDLIQTNPIGPGIIGIKYKPKNTKVKIEESHLKDFCTLLFPPGVKVQLEKDSNLETPELQRSEHFSIKQSTKNGIKDKYLKNLNDEGEDLLRVALSNDFGYDPFQDKYDTYNTSNSIFLKHNHCNVNLKSLISLYQKIYISMPFEDMLKKPDNFYGYQKNEILKLIEKGRIVPIFEQNLNRYSEATIKDFTQNNLFIGPQHFASLIAKDMVFRNPLWLAAQSDFYSIKILFDNLKNELKKHSVKNKEEELSINLFNSWLEFQIDSITEFTRLFLSEGSLTPVHFGPGAFLLKIYPVLFPGNKVPDLELMFSGLEIVHASALNSICLPDMPNNIKLYEILGSIYSGKKTNNFNDLKLLSKMDEILKSIEINCPENIGILEWATMMDEDKIIHYQKLISDVFSNITTGSIEEIRELTNKLINEVNNLESKKTNFNNKVENLSLLGLAIDSVIGISQISVPFMSGWFIGSLLKNYAPSIWAIIEMHPTLEHIKNIVTSIGTKSSMNSVRLLNIQHKLNLKNKE